LGMARDAEPAVATIASDFELQVSADTRQESPNSREEGRLRPSLAALPSPQSVPGSTASIRTAASRERPRAVRQVTVGQRGQAGRPRIEAEEGDDARREPKFRCSAVEFLVGDRALVHTEPVGELALQKAKVEAALP
jgi:hypothetical protein